MVTGETEFSCFMKLDLGADGEDQTEREAGLLRAAQEETSLILWFMSGSLC